LSRKRSTQPSGSTGPPQRAPLAESSRPDRVTPQEGDTNNPDAGKSAISLSAESLFKKASPAVVRIEVRDANNSKLGSGSGFVVSKEGLVATNYHVIRGGTSARAYFDDGQFFNEVLGVAAFDSEADLVILNINGNSFPFLERSALPLPPVGSKVYAIGSPRGLTNTLSEGLVSGQRSIGKVSTVIQTTAPISPGSSGGPLLTSDGKVVGVTTAFISGDAQNLNIAVPIDRLDRLILARGPLQKLADISGELLWTKEEKENL